MKVINKEGMLFEKISIIDILIVAIIIVAGIFVFQFVQKEDLEKTEGVDVYYTFEVNGAKQHLVDAIEEGVEVFNSAANYPVGKIVGLEVKPYERISEDEVAGEFVKVIEPDKYRLRIRIKAKGTVNHKEVYAGQELIRIGYSFPIKGLGFATYGVVVDVEEEAHE